PASLAFSPDGHTLAAVDALGSPLVLWDVATGQPRLTKPSGLGVDRFQGAIAFSPDGGTVATGATDGAVRLWDVASAQPIGPPFTRLPVINGQVQGTSARVGALAFAADGHSLISATVGETFAGTTGPNEIVRWDLSVPSWQQQSCTIANRNLTTAEWTQYVGTFAAYEKTCADFP
nr:hypothetical protein [Actinomycetota bacterium]